MTASTQRGSVRPSRIARAHLTESLAALSVSGEAFDRAARWGRRLAGSLPHGARLLIAGNGGSAAEAQHLSAALVGRFRDDRRPFSAIALHCDTSSLTAILNEFGADEVYSRQVRAHGSPGDVLLLLSTGGRSRSLLAAADCANEIGLSTWALTGPLPNPLAGMCQEVAAIHGSTTAAVQEGHLVALHILCAAFDEALASADRSSAAQFPPPR